MANEQQDLHNEFLCGKLEEQEFQEGRNIWHEDLAELQVTRAIVTDIGDSGGALNGRRFLEGNKKFAKFFYLRLIGNYYAGDFTFETKDDNFSRFFGEIWPEIISKGFYGTVYIGFDDHLYELEKKVVISTGKQWWREEHFPLSKMRLYVMEPDSDEVPNNGKPYKAKYQRYPKFRSVWTNVGGIKINPERLVRFSLNGISNFIFLWEVLDKYFDDLQLYDRYFALATKRLMVDVQDEKKAQKEAELLICSNMPFMPFNNATKGGSQNDNEWDEFPSPDLEGLAIVMHALLARMDERMRFIGAYGKAMGQTKERKQVGETWLDHKWVNNIREVHKLKIDCMLKGLKIIFKGKVPYDLRVKITSQEPHMDERFKEMHNWKGDNFSEGNHHNKMKPLEGEGNF